MDKTVQEDLWWPRYFMRACLNRSKQQDDSRNSKALNAGPVMELATAGLGSPAWAELLSPLPPCWSSSWSSAPACAGARRSPWGPSRWRLCWVCGRREGRRRPARAEAPRPHLHNKSVIGFCRWDLLQDGPDLLMGA